MAITPLLAAPVPRESTPGALARVIAHRHEADQAAVAEMVAVLEYVDGHRVEEGRYLEDGAIDPTLRGMLGRGLVRVIAPNGTEGELRLAGEGTFFIAEFAVAELATALAMSETTGNAPPTTRAWILGSRSRSSISCPT